jgi:hypothetical protein
MPESRNVMQINIDADALRPLIGSVVQETLSRLESNKDAALVRDRLAYSEAEAARLLSLKEHVLRDERRRGRIKASKIVGRRVRYSVEDIRGYLDGRRA